MPGLRISTDAGCSGGSHLDPAIPFALVLQHGPDRRLVGDKMMQIRVCSLLCRVHNPGGGVGYSLIWAI